MDEIHFFTHSVLLIVADHYYNEKDMTVDGRLNVKRIMNGMLEAAVQGGFKQRDIFETLVAQGRVKEAKELSKQACEAAGVRLNPILSSIGSSP